MGADNQSARECGMTLFLIVHFFVHLAIILGAMGATAVVFILRPLPTFPAGWAIVVVDALTAASGTFGLLFVGRFGLFGLHLFCHALSMAGLLSFSLLILIRPDLAVQLLQPVGPPATALRLVVAEGSAMASLLGLQLKSLLLVAMMKWCNVDKPTDDVEAGKGGVLPTIKEGGEGEADGEGGGEGEGEGRCGPMSKQQQLASEMRAKYGLPVRSSTGTKRNKWLPVVMGTKDKVPQVE